MVTISKPRVSKTKNKTKSSLKKDVSALAPVEKTMRVDLQKQITKRKKTDIKKSDKLLKLDVVDVNGNVVDTVPSTFFEHNADTSIIAQAVRVYLHNQREGSAAVKTRGQVEGSTRKIYRQKGTGRARHGSVRAPIFVGGGVVFGPVPGRSKRLMPKKMKRLALQSALRDQYINGNILVVDGLELVKSKTKYMAEALSRIGSLNNMLLIVTSNHTNVLKATRNIKTVDVITSANLNSFVVLKHKPLVFMKPAFSELAKALS